MKGILLTTFFVFSAFIMNGQLSIDHNPVLIANSNDDKSHMILTISNSSDETLDFWWALDTEGSESGWSYSVADQNLSHTIGTLNSPCNESFLNTLAPQSKMDLKVNVHPNSKVGESTIKVKLMTECQGQGSTIVESPLEVKVLKRTSNDDILAKSPLSLYPNPAQNYFKIKDDANVKSVVVLSVVGKFISQSTHKVGKEHNISDLEKGFYLVRLLDAKDGLLNVMRLTKE